jgi:hypothetical protein
MTAEGAVPDDAVPMEETDVKPAICVTNVACHFTVVYGVDGAP